MSRRFVAPPVESRSSTGSVPIIASPTPGIKQDYLPPPSHPALARPRVPSPGPETYGALNRAVPPPPTHPSRAPSPAPPIPSRPPSRSVHSTDFASISAQNVPSDSSAQPQANPIYSYGPAIAQPEPRLNAPQSLPSSDVSTPVLLVTPVTTSGNVDNIPTVDPTFQKTEPLPPYSSEPDLSSQTWPVSMEVPPKSALGIPTGDHNALGLQSQGHTSMTDLSRVAPPLHPSRQPSPSFVDGPGLRHRTLSNANIGSARTLDPIAPPRRPDLEHSRRGSGASILTLKDSNLTDDDLHKMYDAEEVERYLRLFASRVNEVAIDPEHPEATTPIQEEDGDWVSVSSTGWLAVRNTGPLPPHLANPQTPFQYIAALVYPYVNQSRPQSSDAKRKFKLNRAASAAQRLYLAAYPAYVPTLVHLGHLSTWRDPRTSALWCALFWGAWAGGFLSQVIVGRVLYLLYTGGHVTREEIQRRRVAAREAEKLGRAIEGGIPGVGVTGELGVWEVTKLVTGLGKKKSKKAKAAAVEIRNDANGQVNGAEDNSEESEEMEDWKLMLVDLADELADLHERIKNIFLHRRPELTRFYIILLTLLFIGTFIVQDTSRVVTMVMGFWFWFVPPVVKQLPKLPSPFSRAPTDAEVAMELIAKRVERGERVIPERISRRKKNKSVAEPGKLHVLSSGMSSRSMTDLTDASMLKSPSTTSLIDGASSDDEADVGLVVTTSHTSAPQEDKLRKGAVRAWNWLGRTKQLIDQTRGVEPKAVLAHASPEQSFPAQHRSRPGMLMISSDLLSFTPLFASSSSTQSQTQQDTRTIKVDIEHLRGVKKVSPGGLSVRYAKGSEIVEEKFLLVVGRDEAFATLVGWGGGRWKNV